MLALVALAWMVDAIKADWPFHPPGVQLTMFAFALRRFRDFLR